MAIQQRSLGQNIQKLRQQANLTQDDLSDRAGLAYSTLAKIERGAIKNPSVFTVASLAKSLKVSVEDLLSYQSQLIDSATKQPTVKFLFIDMNGVIVRFYQRAFVKLSRETGINMEAIESAYLHYHDAANKGELSNIQFNHAMAQHLGLKSFDWTKNYVEAVEPISEMHKLLESLVGKVKLGVLTNTMPGFFETLKKHKYIPDIKFDTIIDSSVVKAIKPEPKIYEIAEQQSGCSGSEILFIDDSRTNLMAAERFGWRVLWFDDYRPAESVSRVKDALNL